jgi:2-oxoglutarate ferredoxin oxidoreductase subunit alpha
MDRLLLKHKAAAAFGPPPEIRRRLGARFGVVTLGGCDPAVREGLDLLAERGIIADSMRIRGFPFDEPVEAFLNGHDFCFVIEQNRDAQLRSLFSLETRVPKEKLRSVLVYGGFPLSARHVVEGIMRSLRETDPSLDGHLAPSGVVTSDSLSEHMHIEE